MIINCPVCGGKMIVEKTCKYKRRTYKRWLCKSCDYLMVAAAESFDGLTAKQIIEMASPVKRRNGPSCTSCNNWRGEENPSPCAMGFPDPVIEGPGFARDCSLYQVRG
jgi:transposase-like protein